MAAGISSVISATVGRATYNFECVVWPNPDPLWPIQRPPKVRVLVSAGNVVNLEIPGVREQLEVAADNVTFWKEM